MAKTKQKQVIEIDVLTKGLDAAEKGFQSLAGNTGELRKKADVVLKYTKKLRELIDQYGDEIPIKEAKELSQILQKISNISNDITNMDEFSIFSKEQLKQIEIWK